MDLTPVQKKIRSVLESYNNKQSEFIDEAKADPEYHELLKNNNFKLNGTTQNGKVYSHPANGDVVINKHSEWHHIPHGSSSEDGFEGTTGASLNVHLNRLGESVELDEWNSEDLIKNATAAAKAKDAAKSNRTITKFRMPGVKGVQVTQVRHGDKPDVKYDDEGNEIDTQTGETKVKRGRGRPTGASGAQPLGGKGGSTGTRSSGIYGGHTFKDPT